MAEDIVRMADLCQRETLIGVDKISLNFYLPEFKPTPCSGPKRGQSTCWRWGDTKAPLAPFQ